MSNQEKCVFRVLSKTGVVGSGFLITELHAITCLHVAEYALGYQKNDGNKIGLGDQLTCQFCFLPDEPVVQGKVVKIYARDDTVCLALSKAVTGSQPAHLVPFGDKYIDSTAVAYGFPAGYPDGVNANGIVAGTMPKSRFQVNFSGTGYKITFGFSGAAVYTSDRENVIGMISASDDTSAIAIASGRGGLLESLALTEIYNSEQYTTPIRWVYSDLLTNLNVDLDGLEVRGLRSEECSCVRRALSTLIEHSSLYVGDRDWDDDLYGYLRDYFEIYRKWNSHAPGVKEAHRRQATLNELRQHRRNFVKSGLMMRGLQARRVDVRVCDDIYKSFSEALRLIHSSARKLLFPNTKEALTKYKAYKRLRGYAS